MGASASGVRAGRAYIELLADDSALRKGLDQAAGRLRSFAGVIAGIGGSLVAAGAAVTAPLAAFAQSSADSGEELYRASQKTGFMVESLSELRFAARQSGAEFGDLQNGLRFMQRSIAGVKDDVEGTTGSLEHLGLTAETLKGKKPEQQFEIIADAIAGIKDPAEKTAAAMKIFGRGGLALLPLMAEGAKGVEKFRQRARELNLTTSTESAKAGTVYNMQMREFNQVMKKLGDTLGSAVLPLLREKAELVTGLVARAVKWAKANKDLVATVFKVAAGVTVVGGVLIGVAGIFTVVGTIVGGVSTALGVLGAVAGAVAAVLSTVLFSGIGLIAAGLVGLAAYLVYTSGVAESVGQYLSDVFGTLKDDATAAFQGIRDALTAGDFQLAARILWAVLRVEWTRGVAALRQLWLDYGLGIVQWAYKTGYDLAYGLTAAWGDIKTQWINLVAALKSAWADFGAFVSKQAISITTEYADSFTAIKAVLGLISDAEADATIAKRDYTAKKDLEQIEADRKTSQAAIAAETQKSQDEQKAANAARLAEMEKEKQQKLAAAGRGDKKALQQAEAELAARQAELAALTGQAKTTAATKGFPKAPGLPPDVAEGIATAVSEIKGGAVGTFNPFAVAGLAGGAMDRLVRAAEKSAVTEDLMYKQLLKTEGLTFG